MERKWGEGWGQKRQDKGSIGGLKAGLDEVWHTDILRFRVLIICKSRRGESNARNPRSSAAADETWVTQPLRFVGSHPFAWKKAKGWGTGLLGAAIAEAL
jgi:hypothetical protein